ncbi:hypothetical protein Angca_007860, partial [Angiostrongylus cantonensis]
GNAVHEIGHVLGFFHTMVRYDRNRYIKLIRNNLDVDILFFKPNVMANFLIVGKNYADVYGLTYDYGSIMHYSEIGYAPSISSTANLPFLQKLCIAKRPYHQRTMGVSVISFPDIFVIKEDYGCNAKCERLTSAMCENGGYPCPRNCSTCTCPSGFGGTLYDQRVSQC